MNLKGINMVGFIIWVLVGIAFIAFGINNYTSKKTVPFGFWANVSTFPVTDVKSYNKSLGKLWCVYGIVFIFLGVPLLCGQNSPYIIISILGVSLETILSMIIYTIKIEGKYRKK
jgi:uncharacterized protein with PQ loop repeat